MMKRLLTYFKKYNLRLILSFFFALISSSVALLTPFVTGRAIDKIIDKGNVDFNAVKSIIILLLIMFAVSAAFQWAVTMLATKISYNITSDLRKEAFEKINNMPLSYFDKTPHGDIMSRLTNDIDTVSDGLLQGMTQLFMGVITFVGSLILMFKLNILITLIIIIVTPAAFIVSSFIAKNISKHFTKQSKIVGELNSYAEEMITNSLLIKTYSLGDEVDRKFKKINSELYTYGQKAQWFSSLINPTTRLINNIVYIFVGVIGSILALNGEVFIGNFKISGVVTVGLIVSFLTYASQFAKPINDITSVSTQLQGASASLKRIFEVIDNETEDNSEKNMLNVTDGKVVFENVSFSYDKDKKLIENLNLEIKPNSIVAIVGSTGAGKTTLVNLLMRFYELDSGRILIDNQDISKVTKESLRTSFAMVLQDAVLFNSTIADNISYGKPDATSEEIINAAKSAHIHKAIINMKDDYDTILGESDGDLSVGQKQLLTIARAMLLNPKMLILDEATSNVDTLTEIYIQRSFKKMMADKTTFIIAHRLSTIKYADVILVMENGKVVQKGTHKELLKQGGTYKKIYESQFQ